MISTLSGRSFIKIQYSSFPFFPVVYPFRIATYYNITSSKREKFKVNDVIFPSGCEACAINQGNKNMKIGIFTGCEARDQIMEKFHSLTKHWTGSNVSFSQKAWKSGGILYIVKIAGFS